MNRRLASLLLVVALLFSGCAPIAPKVEADRQVYASFYPIYALSGLVLGNVPGIRLRCFVQPQDECLRSYQISDWDLYMLAYDADAIIIGGRGLEDFESMLYSLGTSGPALITAMYDLNLYNQSDKTQVTEDSGHLVGANPHLYMAVSGAEKIAASIADAMAELYPALADDIEAGNESAQAKLSALYDETQRICAGVRGEKVILMNEALIYPAIEYGLEVADWYDRESGTTLYGDSLTDLLDELDETDAHVILIEKQAPTELTDALEAAGYAVARIDTMSSYALDAGYDGYIAAQTANAHAIARAYGLEVTD